MVASNRLKDHSRGPELRSLFEKQGQTCAYTGAKLIPGINASLDHKTPESRGGAHDLSNLHWIDMAINSMKNDLTHEEFIALCRTVSSTTKSAIITGSVADPRSSRRSFSSRQWHSDPTAALEAKAQGC